MKIFCIIADVELIDKPVWLDDFRAYFNTSSSLKYHITLKQPCFIEEEKIYDVRDKLEKLFNNPKHKDISLKFDHLLTDKEMDGEVCIMIDSHDGDRLEELHKQINLTLKDYQNYYSTEYETYEANFHPHITIGQDLNEVRYQEALQYLDKKDYVCTGTIKQLNLIIVNNFDSQEASLPENQSIYKL
jgi:2'-5' RNA ligase